MSSSQFESASPRQLHVRLNEDATTSERKGEKSWTVNFPEHKCAGTRHAGGTNIEKYLLDPSINIQIHMLGPAR